MDFSIRDPDTGQIKTWVWVAGAIGAVAVVAVVFGKFGGQVNAGPASVDTSGQSSDQTDSLAALNDAIRQLIQSNNDTGGDNTPPDITPLPPTGNGTIPPVIPRPTATPMYRPTPAQALQLDAANLAKLNSVSPPTSIPTQPKNPVVPKRATGITGTSNIPKSVGSVPKVNPTNPN